MTNSFFDFFQGLSSDVVVCVVVFVLAVAYGLYRGKESLVSLLMSLYLGMIAYTSLPFFKTLVFFKESDTQIFISKAIVYLVVVIAINFVLSRIVVASFTMSKMRNWIEIGFLSVAVAASAIVIAFNALSLSLAYTPSLLSTGVLTSGLALFSTLAASLVIFFFAAR